ncbi:radical SAM protein [bacterium]|nr:radical SAM protein [bacterium]
MKPVNLQTVYKEESPSDCSTESILLERVARQESDVPLTALPSFPKNIMVELSNACNHRCTFCYNRNMKRKIGMIDHELMQRIIREAYDAGARELGLSTTGEPLVNSHLFDYIKLAKETGFTYVYFSTNGGKLTPERVERLFEAKLDSIKFSINAGTAVTYAKIHGRKEFEHVISMVKLIAERRKQLQSSMKILVTCVVTKENRGEQDKLRALLGDVVDDIAFFNDTGAVGPTNSMNTPLPCSMLFNRAHVTWEGYLTTCCVDYENNLTVADLNQVSLKDGWESTVYQEFRKRHMQKDVKGTLCEVCITRKLKSYLPLTTIGHAEDSEVVYPAASEAELS